MDPSYGTGKLYQNVIEDVVTNIRDTFLDEGVDEQVLTELRMLWESKLMNSKAVGNGGYGGEVPLANNGSAGSSKSSGSRQSAQAQAAAAPTIRTDVNSIVPIQITMPRQPNDPPGVQKTITVNVPASCIHNNKLQAILSLPKIQEILCSGAQDASNRLQEEVNVALREDRGSDSVIRQTNRRSHGSAAMQDFVQADGQAANDDSSEEEDEDDLDDDDLDDDFDDKDDDKDDEPEDEGQDEEPLNSGDDVSGDEDPSENIYEVDNVVVCQYDKITRARNKWKFHFKDGIMNLNGKDYVFQRANGDAEW